MKSKFNQIGIIAIAALIGFTLMSCRNPLDARPVNLKTAATPTANPAAGTYNSTQTVTLTSATGGASIYYTVNGNTPTTSSTLYSGSITISQTTTLKAIAVKSGMNNSAVFAAVYTITPDAPWVGYVTTTGTSAPVYGFELPSGDTLGDYNRITARIRTDTPTSGRLRAFGVYSQSSWNGSNGPDMGNANNNKLLSEPGIDNFYHDVSWLEYTVTLATAAKTSQANLNGILILALGVIPPAGSNDGSRTYYIKDIKLTNANATKQVSALRPDDPKLWNGLGASYYVTSWVNGTATQQIRPYEEEDPDDVIRITAVQNQYVRGFGAMSNAFGFSDSARYIEMNDIETAYNPTTGLGLKILRIRIFTTPLATLITQSSMNHKDTYIQAVQKVNQYGGYVLATPWSPPADYKTNNSVNGGGTLKPERYADYANYLRTFVSEMASRNAPIYAVSVQNEPDYEVGYDGMELEPDEHLNFLRDHGASISRSPTAVAGYGGGKAQPYVKVASAETFQVSANWYGPAMDAVLANATASANMDIAAYHTYGNFGNRALVTRNGALARETWLTEYNDHDSNAPGYAAENYPTWDFVWPFADTVHHAIRNNDSSAYIWWYLKRFYGLIGDGTCGTVNGAILPRGHVLSHYARYATDTVRVDATSGGNISVTAYQRKKTKTTALEQQVMANEDSYSIVMFDKRTTAGDPNLLRIYLPDGFTATSVSGIISDSTGNRRAALNIALNPGGGSADVTLPRNAIISVKFVQ